MEVDLSYNKYLIELMTNNELKREYQNNFNINLYMTLLALNNANYKESMYQEELNIIEDFLRKINNLKVKIQLKRKESEIDELLDIIKKIYQNNNKIIDRYNKEHINIIDVLNIKNTKQLTNLLDKLTKVKMNLISNKPKYDNIRNELINNISKYNYYIKDNNITINNITISLTDFYEIFSYLLNIKNYKDTYPSQENNELHKQLIEKIINLINSKSNLNSEIIPIVLTNLLPKKIPNYETISTSNFSIDNIKITDLYSLANTNNNITNMNTAKWQKILIPNEYLYNKIKEIVSKGMYYFKEDNFIIENIENTTSDFKVSISINNIKSFLKDNLERLETE